MNDDEHAAGLAPTPGYRYADRVGDRLHLAGQVPLDGAGQLVGAGDAGAQDAWVAITECFDGNVPPATLLWVNRLGYAGQLVELDARVER